MKFVIKAEMNGEVLPGELVKIADNLAEFTVAKDLDMVGGLNAGQFSVTPKDNLGIDGLSGKTYAAPNSYGEVQIDVSAISWPQDTEGAKDKALLSIFQPLVDAYNKAKPSKAKIVPKP
jgi:hypothetical protein